MSDEREVRQRLKNMIVKRLELKMAPGEISDEMPLFGDGLGLDSVEALEIVVGLEEEFDVSVDAAAGIKERFFSITSLEAYVRELIEAKRKAVA